MVSGAECNSIKECTKYVIRGLIRTRCLPFALMYYRQPYASGATTVHAIKCDSWSERECSTNTETQ